MTKVEEVIEFLKKHGRCKTIPELMEQFNCGKHTIRRALEELNLNYSSLVLKSRWQQQKKGGETIWLESYKAKETDFLLQFSDLKSEFIQELKNVSENKPKHKETSGYLLEIGIPDFHFGKYTGESLKEQADKFVEKTVSLYEKACKQYDLEKVVFPIGNDFFNTDTVSYTTTKGTLQLDNALWKDTFKFGWRAVVETINYINRKHAVQIPIVPGNHDEQKAFCLGEVIEAYYTNNRSVQIDNSNHPRKYVHWNNCLFGYTHGNNEKHAELPIIMATEKPVEFAASTYRFIRVGHLHKHMHDEQHGVAITVLPSLSKPAEWLKKMGFNLAVKRCQ